MRRAKRETGKPTPVSPSAREGFYAKRARRASWVTAQARSWLRGAHPHLGYRPAGAGNRKTPPRASALVTHGGLEPQPADRQDLRCRCRSHRGYGEDLQDLKAGDAAPAFQYGKQPPRLT